MRGLIVIKMGGKSYGDEFAFQQGQHVLHFTTFYASIQLSTLYK